jgi:hypothetical protein
MVSVEDHNFGPLSNSQVKGNVSYVSITRKCDLLKGSTWLMCHFLLKVMFIWLEA